MPYFTLHTCAELRPTTYRTQLCHALFIWVLQNNKGFKRWTRISPGLFLLHRQHETSSKTCCLQKCKQITSPFEKGKALFIKVSFLDNLHTGLRATTSQNSLSFKKKKPVTTQLSGDILTTFLLDNRLSSKGNRIINIT